MAKLTKRTRALLQRALERRKRGRLGRAPPQAQPDAIRAAYFAELRAPLRRFRARVRAELLPILFEELEAERERGDAAAHLDATRRERSLRKLRALERELLGAFENGKIEALAKRFAYRTSEHQRRELGKQVRAVLAIDLPAVEPNLAPLIRGFARENVDLVRTLPGELTTRLERTIREEGLGGRRAESIAAELERAGEVSESRALVIARDQIGKLNGQVNQERQTALGVDGYIWRTMRDNRVREAHQLRDGQRFAWDGEPPGDPSDPADYGHPGEPIQCRCYAEPDLSGILIAAEGSPE